ncbi:MAG: hypothetical protein Q9160_007743 [Pyrenula sp. 1 TL-2023]
MLRSTLPLSCFVWLLFPLIVRTEIIIDSVNKPHNPGNSRLENGQFKFPAPKGSCDSGQESKIKADIAIAKKMAKDTLDALNLGTTKDIGTLANGVFDELFTRDEFDDVKTQLSAVGTIEKNKIVIFCNEDHHVMLQDAKLKTSTWDDSTWEGKDRQGNTAFVMIGREAQIQANPDAPVPNPRQKICQSDPLMDAYTSLGDNELAGEFHIVLCSSYFNGNSESAKLDTRSIDDINAKGLKRDEDLNYLNNIYPSSRTILHEFMHVIGGPARDVNGNPHFAFSSIAAPQWITDIPAVPCYGYTWCAAIKRRYAAEKNPAVKQNLLPSRNADSFVSLCLAVAIQPKVNSAGQPITRVPNTCMWFAGYVDVDTLEVPQDFLAQGS